MEPRHDPELLNAFRSGDREAFAILYVRHEALVRATCARAAAPGEVDDCLQAVFLVLAERPESAARAPSLAAWLVRVGWYVARHSRRAWTRRKRLEGSWADPHPTAPDADAEVMAHLEEGLGRLPERQRQALLLQHLGGLAPDEVAKALGTSRDNAYQLMHRGQQRLRSFLESRGFKGSSAAALLLLLGSGAQGHEGNPIAITGLRPASATARGLARAAERMLSLGRLLPTALAASLTLPLVAAALWAAEATAGNVPGMVDLEAADTPVTVVLERLTSATGTSLRLDPRVATATLPHLTITRQRLPTEEALRVIGRMTGTTPRHQGAGWVLEPAPAQVAQTVEPPPRATNLQELLRRQGRDAAEQILRSGLDTLVTLPVQEVTLTRHLALLHQATDVRLQVDEALEQEYTFRYFSTTTNLPLHEVLTATAAKLGLALEIRDGAVAFIRPQAKGLPLGLFLAKSAAQGADHAWERMLEHPLTLDFKDAVLEDVFSFIRLVSGRLPIESHVEPAVLKRTVSLQANNLPFSTILLQVAAQTGTYLSIRQGVLIVASPQPPPTGSTRLQDFLREPGQDPDAVRLRAALNASITLRVDHMSLAHVLEFYGRLSDVPVTQDEDLREHVTIDCSLDIKDQALGSALVTMAKDLGLEVLVRGGVVVFTRPRTSGIPLGVFLGTPTKSVADRPLQKTLQAPTSLNVHEVTIAQLATTLSSLSGVPVTTDPALLADPTRRITCDANGDSLDRALLRLCAEAHLTVSLLAGGLHLEPAR